MDAANELAFVKANSAKIREYYSRYGKVNGVGVGADGIVVYFESLSRKLADIPGEYENHKVLPKKIGRIRPSKVSV